MEAIETAAQISVGRACGFAGLGVLCLMLGLSFDPVLAARAGGLLCLAVTLILTIYAVRARKRPYRDTEVWLILSREDRPPESVAQQVIGEALRQTYFWFARQSALVAIVLLASAATLSILGVGLSWAGPG